MLKPETKLTLELMDDLGIPDMQPQYPPQQQAALIERQPQQQQQPSGLSELPELPAGTAAAPAAGWCMSSRIIRHLRQLSCGRG